MTAEQVERHNAKVRARVEIYGPFDQRSGREILPPKRTKHGAVKTERRRPDSALETEMNEQLAIMAFAGHIAFYDRQYRYLPDRLFRADFAWPERMIALEVDGAVHRIKGAFKKSFEREYVLKMAGWNVLHVGGDEVRSGLALQWITALLRK